MTSKLMPPKQNKPQERSASLSNEDQNAVQKLMNSVGILNVLLVESNARMCDSLPEAIRVGIEHRASGAQSDDLKKVCIIVHFRLNATPQDQSNADSVFEIEAVFHVYYELKDPFRASEAALNQFAAVNGTFNLWPYWREFVQSMTTRMGVPPITIPSFRVDKAWTDVKLPNPQAIQ